jgi:hypothetical protein
MPGTLLLSPSPPLICCISRLSCGVCSRESGGVSLQCQWECGRGRRANATPGPPFAWPLRVARGAARGEKRQACPNARSEESTGCCSGSREGGPVVALPLGCGASESVLLGYGRQRNWLACVRGSQAIAEVVVIPLKRGRSVGFCGGPSF